MSSKVSIIIPVYNVEEYLKQCLDSVVNQTLKEIEIICVNDGSIDGSLQILEEYAQKDKRIKIITEKNGGLGAARNTGMEYATGEYIGFVDSDDWIDLTMYEKLYKNAKSQNSDIVMCPIHLFDDTAKKLRYNHPYYTLECFNEDFDNRVFNHDDTKDFLFKISVTAWNKIYKKKFLDEINAKFPEGLIFEDNPFFHKVYLNANNVSLIRDFLYFYRINRSDSIISKADKRFFDIIKIHDLNTKIFIETDNFDEYRFDLQAHMIGTLFYRYSQVDETNKKEFFELIMQNFEKINIKSDEIAKLNAPVKAKYQNFINSNSYKEFGLLEEISQLKSTNNKLRHQKKAYETKIKEITSSNSWKLTKPLRMIGIKIKVSQRRFKSFNQGNNKALE